MCRKEKALVYDLIIDDIQNAQFQLPYVALTGTVQNNSVNYYLLLKDIKDKDRYAIAGKISAITDANEVQITSKNLMLNYEPWKIDPANRIRIGNKGINASNFELSKSGSSITIQSQNNQDNVLLLLILKILKLKL
jgi:hypothetical protein